MDELILTAYELATLLVPFLVAYAAVRVHAQRTGRTATGLAPAVVFAFYVFAVLYVTGVGTVYDLANVLGGANGVGKGVGHVNLHLFWGGVSVGAVLNAVMFAPLGFLLPLI